MSYGLVGTGIEYRQQAMQGLQQAAQEETNRQIENKQIQAQHHAANQQLGALGGAVGALALGFGPVGALIGALGGGVMGGLF